MPEVTQAQQPEHVSGEAFQSIQDSITAPSSSNGVWMESGAECHLSPRRRRQLDAIQGDDQTLIEC